MKHQQFIFKAFILSLLMGFSAAVYADTYPAQTYTVLQQCTDYNSSTIHQAYVLDLGLNPDQWSGHKCGFYNSSDVLQNGIANWNDRLICPVSSGGTLSGTSCINATPCTAPQVRNLITGACEAPLTVCPATEYDNAGVCTPIPDCNADSPIGRNFFDIVTKSCQSQSSVTTVCISDLNTKYCPPIDDCKPAGYICTNNPQTAAEENAARAAAIAASQASAQQKIDEINAARSAAQAAVDAKVAATADAKAALAAAKAAMDAAKATNDQVAISKAAIDYNNASKQYADALAKLSNSTAAKKGIDDDAAGAGEEIGQIPSSNPGNADGHDKNIDIHVTDTRQRLNDVFSGDGDGSGPGSGLPTSTGPTTDTSGLAKEDTNKAIAIGVQGILDKLGQPDSFSSGGNIHGDGKADGKGAISSSLCQGDCGASPTCAKGSCSPSERIEQLRNLYTLETTAGGECPPINIDLSGQGFGNHSVSVHCELMESVRGAVSLIMTISISIGFIIILMSA